MPLVVKIEFTKPRIIKLLDTKIMPVIQKVSGISYINSIYVFDQVKDRCDPQELIESSDLQGLLYSSLVQDWDLVDMSFHEIMHFASQQIQETQA